MAIDKAVDSAVLETGLTKVADAIRTKGGTSGKLAFPDGMADAVAAIQSGGAEEPYIEYTYAYSSMIKWYYVRTAKMHGYTTVPQKAFYDENNLLSVDIPNDVVSIEGSAFNGCSNLPLVKLPDGLNTIDQYAFQGCTKLALTELPDSIKQIHEYAFADCKALNITRLPSTLTRIDQYAFLGCTGLTEIVIPSSVESVGSASAPGNSWDGRSFKDCTNLAVVTFQGTPNAINTGTFLNCPNLLTINVPWAEGAVAYAPWGATNATINYNYVEGV